MTKLLKKRILVLVGAGASVDFGIPQTTGFAEAIESELRDNQYCVRSGGMDAYDWVKRTLEDYYGDEPWEANFERVYHSLHELAEMNHIDGAVPKFKPVLYPFLTTSYDHTKDALRAAASAMLDAIYKIASTLSSTPKRSLAPLTAFIEGLQKQGIPRIYTTNYDDFFSQASPGLFTGFTNHRNGYSLFSPKDYWTQWDTPGLFHLHGSVHFGFPLSIKRDPDVGIGDLGWYESKEDAIKHAHAGGSGVPRLDGTQLERSAIITGLDKLGRLQQAPYLSYYGGLTRETVEADLIIVLGSGLGDSHLNSCLLQARRTYPPTPIVYVGKWNEGDLQEALRHDPTDQTVAMVHDLRIDVGGRGEMKFEAYPGWTINERTKSAVYTKGFYGFLEDPATFAQVLTEIEA